MTQMLMILARTLCAILPVALMSAPFELPAPTGRYPVGTTSWHLVDRSRQETFAGPGVPYRAPHSQIP